MAFSRFHSISNEFELLLMQDTFLQAAKLTEGFSGRELAKLVTYVQAWIYSSKLHNGALCLSATSLISLVQKKAEEHKHKEKFRQ